MNQSGNMSTIPSQIEEEGHLAAFQDKIITTGSEASILLMVLLAILFTVQVIRKMYHYFTLQSQLENVETPVDSTSDAHTYKTTWEEKELYLLKKKEGADTAVLKDLLVKRAIKCIKAFRVLEKDDKAICNAWDEDVLPQDIWDDYQDAQEDVDTEILAVVKEGKECKLEWDDKHGTDVIGRALEIVDKKVPAVTNVNKKLSRREKKEQKKKDKRIKRLDLQMQRNAQRAGAVQPQLRRRKPKRRFAQK